MNYELLLARLSREGGRYLWSAEVVESGRLAVECIKSRASASSPARLVTPLPPFLLFARQSGTHTHTHTRTRTPARAHPHAHTPVLTPRRFSSSFD